MNIEKLHQLCGETLKFLGRNYQIYTTDVMIMLEQLINIYHMRKEVKARIDEKLIRLDERLEYYRKKEVENGTH